MTDADGLVCPYGGGGSPSRLSCGRGRRSAVAVQRLPLMAAVDGRRSWPPFTPYRTGAAAGAGAWPVGRVVKVPRPWVRLRNRVA